LIILIIFGEVYYHEGLMGFKKISTTSVLEAGKISPLTVPDGGVVLSRPRPTLGCSAHDDDDDDVLS
jgi:hypothetical protein